MPDIAILSRKGFLIDYKPLASFVFTPVFCGENRQKPICLKW